MVRSFWKNIHTLHSYQTILKTKQLNEEGLTICPVTPNSDLGLDFDGVMTEEMINLIEDQKKPLSLLCGNNSSSSSSSKKVSNQELVDKAKPGFYIVAKYLRNFSYSFPTSDGFSSVIRIRISYSNVGSKFLPLVGTECNQ